MTEIEFKNLNRYKLKDLLYETGLIIVRNCKINIDEFEHIAESLGKNLVTDKHTLNKKKTIQELSNTGLFGNNDVNWHNDWSYGRGNYFGTILYNVKNAELSPTWFMDMSTLPQEFYK